MPPVEVLRAQYALTQGSRQVLFAYCETITPDDLNKEIEGFGFGSISSLLCHIASTYIGWLQNFGLDKDIPFLANSAIKTMSDAYAEYEKVDGYVEEFLNAFADDLQVELIRYVARHNKTLTITPLTLFTHVLTHEYHHKGQILSMSRHLGYTPVDTDALRF